MLLYGWPLPGMCPPHEIYSHFKGKIVFTVLSVVRDGMSSQCEVPRDPRFPECPGKVDVSISTCVAFMVVQLLFVTVYTVYIHAACMYVCEYVHIQ